MKTKEMIIKKVEDCLKKGSYEEARKLCNEILAQSPNDWYVWGRKGDSFLGQGMEEEAKQAYLKSKQILAEEGIELHVGDPGSYEIHI